MEGRGSPDDRGIDYRHVYLDPFLIISEYSLIKIGSKTAAIYLYEKKLKNNMRISYLNEDDNVWEKPITLYNNEYIIVPTVTSNTPIIIEVI